MDWLGAALVAATVTTAQSESSVDSFDRRKPEEAMSFTTMMVHVDVERDCEQRVQLALALPDRFQAALIGVAGLALRPAFASGGVVVYRQPTDMSAARRACVARGQSGGSRHRRSTADGPQRVGFCRSRRDPATGGPTRPGSPRHRRSAAAPPRGGGGVERHA